MVADISYIGHESIFDLCFVLLVTASEEIKTLERVVQRNTEKQKK
jgi:hypothetical protein